VRHVGLILPLPIALYSAFLTHRHVPFAGPSALALVTALLRHFGGPRRTDNDLAAELQSSLALSLILRHFVAQMTWASALSAVGWAGVALAIELGREWVKEPDPGAR